MRSRAEMTNSTRSNNLDALYHIPNTRSSKAKSSLIRFS